MESDKISMEIDSSSTPMEVTGKLFHYNKGAAFFRFVKDGKEDICLFRPNKIFVDKQKLGASNFKSIDAISKVMEVGDVVSGLVVPHSDSKSYKIDGLACEITPTWYAQAIWKGVKPEDVLNSIQGVQVDETKFKAEQDIIIDNVPGKIVHNRMTAGLKGGANQTFIAFTNPDGKPDLAMFRNPRYFYVDGERSKPDLIKLWPVNQELEVTFTGIYTPSLKEYVHSGGGGDDGMSVETKYKPNWRARLVWTGTRPSEETVDSDNADRTYMARSRRDKSEFLETIKDCEYMCARLEKIISKSQGILMLKSRGILFNIENLSIDGMTFTPEDDLHDHLEIGENLFAYVKSTNSRIIDDYEISFEAAQIWKGKRSFSVSEDVKVEKKKTPIPLPSEASHNDVCGSVIEIEGPGLGYIQIESDDGDINGDKALFSRNRLYINGQKLRFKDSIKDHVNVGEQLYFDMVRADPEEAGGEYKWMAVLTWKGQKPDIDEINEISKKIENYRAKILMFDEWDSNLGYTSGILQVMGGSSKIGERAFFSREQVYVFGACMAQADLGYVLKVNDKVQLELSELGEVVNMFGVEIKYSASLVWVGPPPKLDENCADFPHYVGNVILPFITKRGFTEEDFTRLVRGEMAPKSRGDSMGSSGALNPAPAKKQPLILPPNTIFGRVVELKKPEQTSLTGTEHGILQIENGPWERGKAFFNRNCLFCWGHNCAKADLMYLIQDGDKFCVEVADGTNNKAVPYKVTSAWIGPHPHEKNKESAAMAGNPHFMKWCKEHGLTVDLFRQVIAGEAQVRPFFPLAGDQHQAKVAYLFPQSSSKTGSDGGVLRLFGGHPNSKEGRKAPEVLFERESVYIWNVQLASGDLNYVLQENDKVFVEVADLLGKEKKKWQSRLGSVQVPRFIASLVFVGGGRPKAERVTEDFTKNANLVQWLNKRNIDINLFSKLIDGKLPHKTLETGGEDMYSQDYPNLSSFQNLGMVKPKQGTPFNNPVLGSGGAISRPLAGGWGHGAATSGGAMKSNAFANPIMRQAEDLTQRTMLLQSPEDPDVTNLIQDDSEAQLALFLSKTLTNAIMMYRQGGPTVGPIGPPGNKPGPIGPPRGKGGNSRGGRGQDFNEFYADSAMSGRGGAGRGGGLYGLSEPLLQYHSTQHSPSQHFSPNTSMEPPYKRKYEDW